MSAPPRRSPRRPLAALATVSTVLATALTTLVATPSSAATLDDGLVARYSLDQTSGSTVADASGHGRTATISGDTSWLGSDGLKLGGTNGHLRLPNDVMRGLTDISVSTQVLIDPSQATPYFIWGLGNTLNGVGNGYLFTTGNGYRTSIASGNWSTEQTVSAGRDLARGKWRTLTYTLADGTGVLYEDGVEVGRRTGITTTPGSIGGGTTTANYLGRSVYSADRYLKGQVRDFRIYDRALTPDEATRLGAATAGGRVAADAAAITLADTSAVTEDLTLPTAGAGGSSIVWSSSDTAVVASDGTVTRPAPGSGNVSVSLSATVSWGGASEARTFVVTVVEDVTDEQKVANALAAVSIPDSDAVRGNVTLPTSGARGVALTWSTKDPEVVAATGEVTRPVVGSRAATARLTVRGALGDVSATRNITLTVLPLPKKEPLEGYAFAYFTGEGTADGEQVYMAASRGNDPLHWDELNGGRPILTSTEGEQGVRDPFVIRSPEGDRFFLIATDLKINGNGNWDRSQRHGSRHIEVWESTDLVNWGQQRHVQVSPAEAGNTWAPEAYYDESIGAYVVFWASKLYAADDPNHTGNTYNRMMYATTRDFRTFSEPEVWVDPGYSVIDSTVVGHDGTYYRFTKDERNNTSSTPCSKFILEQKSTSLRSTSWSHVKDCIGKATPTSPGINQGEGPTIFKSNTEDKWYLFIDEFGGRGYVPFETTDLESGSFTISRDYELPGRPRHGTVLPVTRSELERLKAGPSSAASTRKGVVADYRFGGSGTTVVDQSGNQPAATIRGGATRTADAVELGGVDGHVDLPDNLLAGLDAVTVSTEVWIDPAQPTPYFLWGLGNTLNGAGTGYLFATGDAYRTAIAPGSYSTEQNTASGRDVSRGSWHTLTYTLSGGTAVLYDNGVEVARNTGITVKPGELGDGTTTAGYVGRSLYNGDRYLKGKVRSFTIWNRGLAAKEVLALPGNETAIGSVTLDSLRTAPIIDSTAGTVVLPVQPGTDVSHLAPELGVPGDARVTPGNGSQQDFSSPVTYTVTGTNGASRTWTVRAVVMDSPVLPGHNADPNIVRFGDTYWIYATTDGHAGWGSTTFKPWSSTDLVHWTEHPVILDLGPDVSWADGRAWAPAAIEKDGKYYFYFCADAKIGVAVADSPAGPFRDAIGKPLVAANPDGGGQAIDPAVFTDDDGQTYLYWGNGNAYVVPLNPDLTSYDPAKVTRLTGLTGFREGLFVHKRQGTYYLSWSIDDTRSENYRVGYATMSSPTGAGLTNRGEILTKDTSLGILGTGHHSVIQVPGTDDWYIAYHRFAIPGGDGTHREVTIDRLRHNADGTIAPVVPTLESIAPLT